MSTQPPDDATLAALVVTEAGRLALRMRRDGVSAQQKTSVSDVVTAADRAAEDLVTGLIAQHRPDDAILGEEGTSRPGTSGRTWVIDPVDGTYNFVQGLDWWCSAVALQVDGRPVLGAIHHAALDALHVGGHGTPATLDGTELAPLEDRSLATSCVATYLHPPWVDTEVGEAFGRFASRAATLRMLGSGTMDAMAVARGRLHVVCQHSVPPWDWMPGAALIEAVGGSWRHVEAAGRTWYVAGAPTAVAEVCAALDNR